MEATEWGIVCCAVKSRSKVRVSLYEILKCDHSNESYREVRSRGTVFMLHKVVLTFESVDEILKCAIQMKVPEKYFPLVCCLLSCMRWFCFESVDACTCALCNSSNSLCG